MPNDELMPEVDAAATPEPSASTSDDAISVEETLEKVFTQDTKDAVGNYRDVLVSLKEAIWWLRWAALGIFVLGGGFVVYAVVTLPALTDRAAEKIAANPDKYSIMIFELFRGAAFAAVVASLIFGVLGLGRAALDQATRYQKRLMAANFMHYVLVRYEDQIKNGKIKLDDVVNFIDAWSKNVESAFTHVRFGSAKSQNLKLSVDRKGNLVAEQGTGAPQKKSSGSSQDS